MFSDSKSTLSICCASSKFALEGRQEILSVFSDSKSTLSICCASSLSVTGNTGSPSGKATPWASPSQDNPGYDPGIGFVDWDNPGYVGIRFLDLHIPG